VKFPIYALSESFRRIAGINALTHVFEQKDQYHQELSGGNRLFCLLFGESSEDRTMVRKGDVFFSSCKYKGIEQ
jgi:hypothetical protein